jgi:hypothetical protein
MNLSTKQLEAYHIFKIKLIDALFDNKINKAQYYYLDDYIRDMRYNAEQRYRIESIMGFNHLE